MMLAADRVPVGNVRLPGGRALLPGCPDEVAGARFAGVAPWPGTAPGDVDVAEHDGVGTVGVLPACRRVLDLRMQVRFVGVPAVADRSQRLAAAHDVSHVDRDAA